MSDFNEHEVITRCQQGDETAFKELVDHFKDLVFALAARSVQDRSLAEDVAQEVFLRVHRGLPYFRREARLSTWIYRIVANVCAQERARHRFAFRPLDPDPGQDRVPLEPAVRATAASDLELRDRLEKALRQLPANYRLLVNAHYLKGVQYEELAEALGLPLGTIKTHLYRAKRRLRELLEEPERMDR